MSPDGVLWTEPAVISNNGTPARASSPPGLTFDGTTYHLYWVEPDGSVRYAASRDAERWIVQESAMTNLPARSFPSFAFGAGRHLAVVGGSGGVIAIDLASPVNRVTIAPQSAFTPSLVFGNGQFLAAVGDSAGRINVFRSTDGGSWTQAATLPQPSVYLLQIGFAEGQFLIAAKAQPGSHCVLFTSGDGQTWSEAAAPGCGNTSTGVAAVRFRGTSVYLENFDNRFLSVGTGNGPLVGTHAAGLIGAPAVDVGHGSQLLALRLENLRVTRGTGQDLTVLTLGYRVRVGAPGSAHVSRAGWLTEFGSGIDAGQTVRIPAAQSPFVWVILPPENLGKPNAQVDVAGAAIVGIERGNCPESAIAGKLNEVSGIVQQALNEKIAAATLDDLQDTMRRQRILQELQDEVRRRLGGGASWFERTFGCLFNADELFEQKVVTFVGGFLTDDDPPGLTFKLDPGIPSLALPPIILASSDGTESWEVTSTRTFLPLQ